MIIRDATAADAGAICAIYNDAVLHTTAVFTETPVDPANRVAWIAARQAQGYPVLVAERDGVLAGYASFGDFRAFPGYSLTVEHSVYVAPGQRGGGVGRALMLAVIARARAMGKHAMVGGIEAGNAASISLHLSLGFAESGVLRQVGAKFDRWLDLAFLTLLLDDAPVPSKA